MTVLSLSKAGSQNRIRNKLGTGVASAMSHLSVREEMRRKGLKPKNHHAENLRKMRKVEKENREKQEVRVQLPKKTKLSQRAKSKFMQMAEKTGADLPKHAFLKKRSSPCASPSPTPPERETRGPTQPTTTRSKKPTVPRRNDINRLKREKAKDFLTANKAEAVQVARPKPRAGPTSFMKKKEYGQIPEYLLRRKIELTQQALAAKAAEERAKIPAGMREMNPDEQKATLELLKTNASKVEAALNNLPLKVEGPKMVRREKELRKKLKEIEDGIKIFSKKKVYISVEVDE